MPFMIRNPPMPMTATDKTLRKNSIEEKNSAMTR